jgi:hypothetical protein
VANTVWRHGRRSSRHEVAPHIEAVRVASLQDGFLKLAFAVLDVDPNAVNGFLLAGTVLQLTFDDIAALDPTPPGWPRS